MTNKTSGPTLILGSQGMLGSMLANVFVDHQPIGMDHKECDITNIERVCAVVEKLRPCVVINAAAYNAVDEAETQDGLKAAMAINADGPRYLVAACSALEIPLVHYSTDYVFDGTSVDGYTEKDTPRPQSNYARSKREGEIAVSEYALGFVVRTCRLFGPSGTSPVSKKSFVNIIIERSQTNQELRVVDEEVASPTYVLDLANQTRLLIKGNYSPGFYHMTNTGSCTWFGFAQEILRIAKFQTVITPVPASAFPRPAARPAVSVLRNTTLPPMRSWQEALRDYITNYLSR